MGYSLFHLFVSFDEKVLKKPKRKKNCVNSLKFHRTESLEVRGLKTLYTTGQKGLHTP